MKHIVSVMAVLQLINAKPQQNPWHDQKTNKVMDQQKNQPQVLPASDNFDPSGTRASNSHLHNLNNYEQEKNTSQSKITILPVLLSTALHVANSETSGENFFITGDRNYELAVLNIPNVVSRGVNEQQQNNTVVPSRPPANSYIPPLPTGSNITENNANLTKTGEEPPDSPNRIGTPAIITLQGGG